MPGYLPLLTDENVSGPIIDGLKARGWDVVRTVDLFGERSVDDTIFAWAARERRVFVTTDEDCLVIASTWLEAGRAFRLLYWPQRKHQRTPVASFLAAVRRAGRSSGRPRFSDIHQA